MEMNADKYEEVFASLDEAKMMVQQQSTGGQPSKHSGTSKPPAQPLKSALTQTGPETPKRLKEPKTVRVQTPEEQYCEKLEKGADRIIEKLEWEYQGSQSRLLLQASKSNGQYREHLTVGLKSLEAKTDDLDASMQHMRARYRLYRNQMTAIDQQLEDVKHTIRVQETEREIIRRVRVAAWSRLANLVH
jgi:hypothetical protein